MGVSGAERSLFGFVYQQRLATEFYGEVYRALGANGQEARILHIADELAALDGFAAALTTHGDRLGLLEHKHVQQTILVGCGDDGRFVVVNAALAGPRSLAGVLAGASAADRSVPRPVAYAIGKSLVAALMHAHGVGIVHGSVHPRSVVVDIQGEVVLVHFAAARALADVASALDDVSLLGAREYVAPELALGEPPSAATDVYALGVLMKKLLSGDVPAPIGAWLERAVATDVEQRFPSAIDMRAALRDAMAASGAEVADAATIAAFVSQVGERTPLPELIEPAAADAELDAATAGVLADLEEESVGLHEPDAPGDDDLETNVVDPSVADADADLDDLVADLGSPDPDDELGTDVADPPTAVDPPTGGQIRDDPVSEIIRRNPASSAKQMVRLGAETYLLEEDDDEDTYIPPAITDSDVDLATAARRATTEAEARLGTQPDTDLDMEPVPRTPRPEPVAAPMSIEPLEPTGTDALAARKGGGNLIWIATTLLALGALALVVVTQTDMFDADKRAVSEAELEAERERLQREAERGAIRAGDITVDSDQEGAAVWMLIGRTPVDSVPLGASMPHQIRIEQEGFGAADVTVTGAMWTGGGTAMRAAVSATLEPAVPGKLPPAAPPAPAAASTGREGRGVIHIESEPAGAKAYLLVGFTPAVTLTKVRAGVAYEFKVVKDGFTPGFVLIRPEDWRDGDGFARSIERTATLRELPKGGK